MLFLVLGRSVKNVEGKEKIDRRKTLKSEEKEKRRIWGKSNNKNEHLWFYYLYKKVYLVWKKAVYTIKYCLQFLCVAGYLKHNNYTPKLNIHKYTNYNIIEIYINRLSTAKQIFIAIDYLILMLERYLQFRKRRKHLVRTFFPTS